ncbi:MAG TPA: FHA domain-containing protein [Gemmatimonadaceae bacterium]|nr:FHA domain-containing protein [Gemmatimonadaceae bacterium]
MPVIQVNDKQHTLKPGQTRVGAGPGVDVAVSQDPSLGVQAVFELDGQNRVVIRRAGDSAAVRVNGVPLVDPTPLMHGDKVAVGGTEILFSDDKKVGATQFVSAADIASIAAKRAGPARATAATGGRLVSLVDGKEYQIPAAGITFGREAGSDIVVAQSEVSRRHAVIAPAEGGYTLTDHSTNGVWVNGNRVQGSQLLSRADVVRVGSEEFRFYADVMPSAKPTPAAATPAAPAAPTTPSAPPAPVAPPVAAAPAATPAPASPAPPSAVQSPSPAPAAAPRAPTPPRPEPPTAPRSEPPTTPRPASRVEPPTAPSPLKPAAPARPAARKDAAAGGAEKRGGVPSWVWIVVIVVVAAAAYYLGQQGRG